MSRPRNIVRSRVLNPQQAEFVRHYIACGSAAQAARLSGYSESYAEKGAGRLLKRPAIAAAIAEHHDKLKESTGYDLLAAVAEADELMAEARAAKQYTAASSIFTTKAKLFGLLIDRQVQLTAQVDVAEALREARARLQQPRPNLPANVMNVIPMLPND